MRKVMQCFHYKEEPNYPPYLTAQLLGKRKW